MNGRQGGALAVEIALHLGVRAVVVSIAGCGVRVPSGMFSSAA